MRDGVVVLAGGDERRLVGDADPRAEVLRHEVDGVAAAVGRLDRVDRPRLDAHRAVEQPEDREQDDHADDHRREQLDEREAALVGEPGTHHVHVPTGSVEAMSSVSCVPLKFVLSRAVSSLRVPSETQMSTLAAYGKPGSSISPAALVVRR